MKRSRLACLLLGALSLAGCPSENAEPAATGPQPDTKCPKELPADCKVLKDATDPAKNSVEYHVLVPADTKHGPAQKMLEALYRHLMKRRDNEPAALAGYLYTSEAQFSTPPPSPVAQVVKEAEAKIPTFENKIALELWQQVEEALELEKRADKALKRKLAYAADADTGRVTVTVPLTESGKEDWAPSASFTQTLNQFTDIAQMLFNRAADMKTLNFVARWKDQDVATIEVTRADYPKLQLRELEERIGSLHGRAFQELALQKGSDASVSKSLANRAAAEYRKMLALLKGHVVLSPQLK